MAGTDQSKHVDAAEHHGDQRRWLIWYAVVLLFLILQILLYTWFTEAFS